MGLAETGIMPGASGWRTHPGGRTALRGARLFKEWRKGPRGKSCFLSEGLVKGKGKKGVREDLRKRVFERGV